MMRRSDRTFLCIALLLWLLTLGAGVSLAADDWTDLRDQAAQAYPDRANDIRVTLEKAQKDQTPAADVSMTLDRSVSSSVDADGFMGFVEKLNQAAEQGLPTKAFTEKIMEGLAKNVPPSTIEKVLDTKLGTYTAAKEITSGLEGAPSQKERALESVALSMERGVSTETMREVYAGVKNPAVVYHSSYALADLLSMGFNETQGRRIVKSGIAAGYLSDDHTIIPQVAAKAEKSGRSRDEIAQTMETDFRRGKPLSDIAIDLQGQKGGGHPSRAGEGARRGKGGAAGQGAGAHGKGSGRGGH